MQTIHLIYPLLSSEPFRRQVLAIGEFDGVHLGHQEVIRCAVQTARQLNLPCSIMTFNPHPRLLLGQNEYARLLTPLTEKERLLSQAGVDYTYVVKFDPIIMQAAPEQFIEQMLIPMNVDTVICGYDFTFGYMGRGVPDTLRELARGRFAVKVVKPFYLNGNKVSSSRVRECLQAGAVEEAADLLSRSYRLSGEVVHGDKRGRTIGFPTANIAVSEAFVIPANGVYAVKVHIEGESYDGVMNIGVKPTFTSGDIVPTLEAHILDFNGSIYGKHVTVDMISFIRPERKFSSVRELVDQIHRDVDVGKKLFAR
jgi:riboflavin kinase/FMN adenylyltransferase